jgi:hypothetical protein
VVKIVKICGLSGILGIINIHCFAPGGTQSNTKEKQNFYRRREWI